MNKDLNGNLQTYVQGILNTKTENVSETPFFLYEYLDYTQADLNSSWFLKIIFGRILKSP